MDFKIAAHSDAGIQKKVNEDALLVKVAKTLHGKVCLGVLCDGMGGLTHGELASAAVIRAFEAWFDYELGAMVAEGFDFEWLKQVWNSLLTDQNQRLASYAKQRDVRMGTTVVALLILGNTYYAMNVGDSRAYMLNSRMELLTKDHSFVQYAVDMGYISLEQARFHPKRNILLQCVGASNVVEPAYRFGAVFPDTMFLLCSDGFYHTLTAGEIYAGFRPDAAGHEEGMEKKARIYVELNKRRKEKDNISVALIRTCSEE